MQNHERGILLPSLRAREVGLPSSAGAGLAALLAVLGLSTIWSSVVLLWLLWTTDALKSIGMVVPVVSFLLVLRVWRSLDWELNGTWWGFVLLLGTMILVQIRNQAVILLVLSPQWTLFFPPHSVVMFAYGAGLVLLFGGTRLFRACLFPLFLLLLVNPIPHIFNVYVDLPLQRASAHVARAFAIALGQPLSPDKLRLMFTPEFGMFIAPGCNGIRGAVTMGFIALVAGYLYRFRLKAHVGVVAGAIALGYVFNFVRLCVLVLFYLVALHFPALQDRAENADYLIGAALFFVAVYLLYLVIGHLGASTASTAPTASPAATASAEAGVWALPRASGTSARSASVPATFYLRAAAFAFLVAFGLVGIARGFHSKDVSAGISAEEHAQGQFPPTDGKYTLVRTWNEDLLTGTLLFHWAEYAPGDGGTHISIGVSPLLGAHDTMVCHSARGEDPIWHGQQLFHTGATGRGADEVSFNASFFNDGATQYLEESTICSGAGCGEYASTGTHLGFVYSKIDVSNVLNQNAMRPMPVLLKAETIDTTLPPAQARAQLSADVASFLSGINVESLTQPYRRE